MPHDYLQTRTTTPRPALATILPPQIRPTVTLSNTAPDDATESQSVGTQLETRILVLSQSTELVNFVSQVTRDVTACPSSETLLDSLNKPICGCVILDVNGSVNVGDFVRDVRASALALPVVAVVAQRDIRNVLEVLRLGATEVVLWPTTNAHLQEVIDRVIEKDAGGIHSPSWIRARMAQLTDRERDVLLRCLDGTNTKVIAKELGVTYQTVDKHRSKALRKLEVQSTVEFVDLLSRIRLSSLGYSDSRVLSFQTAT